MKKLYISLILLFISFNVHSQIVLGSNEDEPYSKNGPQDVPVSPIDDWIPLFIVVAGIMGVYVYTKRTGVLSKKS